VLWNPPILGAYTAFARSSADIDCFARDTPSLRLLADETAKVLAGMLQVLDG